MAEHITDHRARALARLATQYRGKPRLEGVVSAHADQTQEVEDALQALATSRTLDGATGAGLDDVGRLLGERREGEGDTDYRARLRVKILTIDGSATVPQLLAIARLLVAAGVTLRLVEYPPASMVMRAHGAGITDAEAERLARMLRRAKAGGVRLVVEHIQVPETQAFRFNAGPGFGVGRLAGAK